MVQLVGCCVGVGVRALGQESRHGLLCSAAPAGGHGAAAGLGTVPIWLTALPCVWPSAESRWPLSPNLLHAACASLPTTCPAPRRLIPSQVREVSENPLAKVAKSASVAVESQEGKKAPKPMETQVLEQSIHKICSLLSVSVAVPFASACARTFARGVCEGACKRLFKGLERRRAMLRLLRGWLSACTHDDGRAPPPRRCPLVR